MPLLTLTFFLEDQFPFLVIVLILSPPPIFTSLSTVSGHKILEHNLSRLTYFALILGHLLVTSLIFT